MSQRANNIITLQLYWQTGSGVLASGLLLWRKVPLEDNGHKQPARNANENQRLKDTESLDKNKEEKY